MIIWIEQGDYIAKYRKPADVGPSPWNSIMGLEGMLEASRFTTWSRLLQVQGTDVENRLQALTPEQELRGACGGYVFYCSDHNYYALKGCQNKRLLIADRVVSMLAEVLQYPVPHAEIVEVSESVLVGLPDYWRPGPAHGSLRLEHVQDSNDVEFARSGENPQRFFDLAVLFGMLLPEDRGFLYELNSPNHVWSHDHDQFLSMINRWDLERAESYLDRSRGLDDFIISATIVNANHLTMSQSKLGYINDEEIARIVGSIPSEWGISDEERTIVCEYLRLVSDRFSSLSPFDQGVA